MTKEQRKAWRKANPEKHRAEQRRYYARNKEKVGRRVSKTRNVYGNIRRTRKSQAGGSFTPLEWKNLCRKYNWRCLCCLKRKKLTPDHVIPVAKGGTSNIENIQPLCLPCNRHKHTGTTDYRVLYNRLAD